MAAHADWAPLLSLAGRTRAPVLPPVPHRIGGFGGADGLAAFLRENWIAAVVDATHPFAAVISRNAAAAASQAGVPLLAIRRPAWQARADDRWLTAPDTEAAVIRLGPGSRRVFLTIGRQALRPFVDAPQHFYLIRSVDPPCPDRLPPRSRVVLGRGPFGEADEITLMQTHAIELLVTKNAGGVASSQKLAAARQLGIPVIMIERPPTPATDAVTDVAGALAWLADHATRRGV